MSDKNCSTCRFHSVNMRPKPIAELGFEALFQVEEKDQPFYRCRAAKGPYAGKEVGFDPIECGSHEYPKTLENAYLEKQIQAWAARNGLTT